jgi:hypothetical protein
MSLLLFAYFLSQVWIQCKTYSTLIYSIAKEVCYEYKTNILHSGVCIALLKYQERLGTEQSEKVPSFFHLRNTRSRFACRISVFYRVPEQSAALMVTFIHSLHSREFRFRFSPAVQLYFREQSRSADLQPLK